MEAQMMMLKQKLRLRLMLKEELYKPCRKQKDSAEPVTALLGVYWLLWLQTKRVNSCELGVKNCPYKLQATATFREPVESWWSLSNSSLLLWKQVRDASHVECCFACSLTHGAGWSLGNTGTIWCALAPSHHILLVIAVTVLWFQCSARLTALQSSRRSDTDKLPSFNNDLTVLDWWSFPNMAVCADQTEKITWLHLPLPAISSCQNKSDWWVLELIQYNYFRRLSRDTYDVKDKGSQASSSASTLIHWLWLH